MAHHILPAGRTDFETFCREASVPELTAALSRLLALGDHLLIAINERQAPFDLEAATENLREDLINWDHGHAMEP